MAGTRAARVPKKTPFATKAVVRATRARTSGERALARGRPRSRRAERPRAPRPGGAVGDEVGEIVERADHVGPGAAELPGARERDHLRGTVDHRALDVGSSRSGAEMPISGCRLQTPEDAEVRADAHHGLHGGPPTTATRMLVERPPSTNDAALR